GERLAGMLQCHGEDCLARRAANPGRDVDRGFQFEFHLSLPAVMMPSMVAVLVPATEIRRIAQQLRRARPLAFVHLTMPPKTRRQSRPTWRPPTRAIVFAASESLARSSWPGRAKPCRTKHGSDGSGSSHARPLWPSSWSLRVAPAWPGARRT